MKPLYLWIVATLLLAVLLVVQLSRSGNSSIWYYALGALVLAVVIGFFVARRPG
ncbi:hypothetical protein [Sphingomonas parva]|uniref:hypothetical protein n=1 Tax=Sphingomonas parva TaxID=2555898 RepID=UPI00142F8DF0|nr:hypothetical protein [Sphingomonas parva]